MYPTETLYTYGKRKSTYRQEVVYCYTSSAEKAVAAHSRTLAWKIPWVEEPGGLQSMGSLTVRHD